MKFIIFLMILLSFNSAMSMSVTEKFQVTKLNYDEEKKYYLVHFFHQASVYVANVSFLSCLQNSLENKKEILIEFDPHGLILTKCSMP